LQTFADLCIRTALSGTEFGSAEQVVEAQLQHIGSPGVENPSLVRWQHFQFSAQVVVGLRLSRADKGTQDFDIRSVALLAVRPFVGHLLFAG
jgi:hypothetical protein